MRHPTTDAQYDFNAIVGAKIALMRKQIGASQQQLAEVIGLGRASMGNIETGTQALTAYNLWRLAEFLKVPVADLLPGTALTEVTDDVATVQLRQTRRLSALLHRAQLLRGHLDDIINEIGELGETP